MVVVIVCCAGPAPALIAAGALGVLGARLSDPWVIAAAVGVTAAAAGVAVRRRRTGRAACCPPTNQAPRTDDRARPRHPVGEEGQGG
ncbi:hypothetical protein [Streptomyces dysideae]|uniref:hypothetical protein n=1 Tax=Streptomyces dysideae TaxID=909626 RepID=UPI000A661297|nr:hypothetical protein [Streptomyces dysideae]